MHNFSVVSRVVRSRGVTLVETAIAVGIASLLAGLAGPSFIASIQRAHVEGVMRQFKTDLRYGYSEAIARGQSVHITFAQTAIGSCYVIASPEPCPCDATGQAACSATSHALRTATLPASSGVTLISNVRQMTFDGRRNTVSPAASIDIRSKGSSALHAIVNIVGRTRICTPDAETGNYQRC